MEVGGANQFNSGRRVVTAMSAAALNVSFGLKSNSPFPGSAGVPPASFLRKRGRDARAPREEQGGAKLHTQGGPMFYRVVLAFAIVASATTFRAPAETLQERQACTPDAQSLCFDETPPALPLNHPLVRQLTRLTP